MEKLKGAVLKLCNSDPNPPLSVTHKIILEERLTQLLSNLSTIPDHPPYACMIERALQQLNEKGGSTEDSISKFIRKEFDNLPWAHFTLLKHHLRKLSKSGEILVVYGKRYLLPNRKII